MITRNQERRIRVDIAIRDVLTKTFQHFLAKHILPADLINEIERLRHKHLSEEEKKTIQSGNFGKFDATLLNKLFVNYGEVIFKGDLRIVCSKEMPPPNNVTVSDDFNRLRFYRNKYVHQIKTENEEIAIEEMEEIKRNFIDSCLRMKERNLPKYKKEEYVAQLQVIFNSDLDRIEELHKRVTNLERARKRLAEEDLQLKGNPKRRKWSILKSINHLTENTKQMRKSKALLIVGEYGVGKSSFVNTVLTAITGIYHEHCEVAQASSSKTNYLHVKRPAEYFNITTDEDEKLWYPTFMDMVGMDKANLSQFNIILEYILDGKLKPFTDLTDFCTNIKEGRKIVEMETREGPIVDAIVFLLAPKSGQIPTNLMENVKNVLKRSAKEIPIFVVMTKIDECDLEEEAKMELKRKICSTFVISMDRILECVNYKRSDTQSGWWDNDTVEKVLNFLTSICDPHLQRRDLVRMEFIDKETSFIHVYGEKIFRSLFSKTYKTMSDKKSILKDLRRRVSALQAYGDNNELYSIVGSLIQKDMTTSKCRHHISAFEEKHLFYFALFKPQTQNPKKSWIENVKRDITNIRKNTVAPSLRECYAVSEVISRNVILMCECEEEGFRGIEIEPVIREKDDKNNTPLILFLRFDGENVHFIRCDENINRFIECGLTITNGKHLKCLDKRFRNNFDTLRHYLLDDEFLFFSSSSFPDAFSVEMTNMFELFAQIIYGTQTSEKGVKDLIKAHVEADDYIQVYMQLVNVQVNVSKNIQKSESKSAKLGEQLTKESFRKRMIDWKTADRVHLFALASVFNTEIYLVSPEDVSGREESDMYLPICGSYLYIFESPVVFKMKKGSTSFEINFEEQCQCCRKTPEIIGEFPIANNTIDLDRIRSLDLKPCCRPKSRHGVHEHYKHILENNKLPDQRDITPWPGGLPDDVKHINDILAEEGRQLELLLGGKGTLAQCISKEVFGDEDEELPISLTENDFERSLQAVADWTGFPIYIFQNCKDNFSWELKTPTTCVKAKNCRYFITIFLQKENGREYVDRIISKTGCNCMLAPPYVTKNVDVSENQDIGKEKRHRPLITFFPTKPQDIWFSDDVRKEMNIILIHSELRLVMERGDMEDRMIDTISDYTHSLYRCISKDIFGNEEQYQTIMEEVIAEIKENSNLYGHLLIAEKESADGEFLKNFKYQERKVLDAFKFRDKILRESATFFTERIEDGMALQDLELVAAATCFQVPIYVLSASTHEDSIETKWKLYSQIRRRKKPEDFMRREQEYFAHIDEVYKCLFDDNNISRFHITLFRTFSGQYHRIAARYRVCNCLMDPPMAFVPQKHKHDNQSDFRIFYHTNRAKSTLTTAKLALDMWMRCNMALEILCSEIIDELEGRRRNVNISTIVGSSAGIAGSAVAIAGVIAAPFTAGVSLGLTVGGAVIGSLSGVTILGATVTEVVLNREANAKFERYYMNFCEQSKVLEDSLKKLQKIIKVIKERTMHTDDASGVDATALQVAAGTLSMIRGIPIVVARIVLSSASLADIVLPPLTAVLDVGFLAYSVHNLIKGSKTNVTEKLRSFRSVLRALRIQLRIMAYGNKIKYFQSPNYKKVKRN